LLPASVIVTVMF